MRARWTVTVMALAWAACGGPSPPPSQWGFAPTAAVTTPGVVIEALDGSFRLSAGQPVPTPFLAYDCPAAPTTTNYDLGARLGARPVRVHHPAAPVPIYGLLSFCPLHPEASALVRRLYDVRVPDLRVEQTEGGRISVVHEPHGEPKRYRDGPVRVPAWVLWLSRSPFQAR